MEAPHRRPMYRGHLALLRVLGSLELLLAPVLLVGERLGRLLLGVVRSLVKRRFLISGGGSAETEACLRLGDIAKKETGAVGFCLQAFADALEVIPYTLAENAGLNPMDMVTQLRKRHRAGEADAGINVKKGCIDNMFANTTVQPLLVNTSALNPPARRLLLRGAPRLADLRLAARGSCSLSLS